MMTENPFHPLHLDNPFSGRTVGNFDYGARVARDTSYRCMGCGQRVDARDLGQVFHHETAGHKPIPPQLVCDA